MVSPIKFNHQFGFRKKEIHLHLSVIIEWDGQDLIEAEMAGGFR